MASFSSRRGGCRASASRDLAGSGRDARARHGDGQALHNATADAERCRQRRPCRSKDLIAGLSGSITTDAQYEAQRAGFTNGLNGVAVNVSTSVTAPAGQTAYTNAVQVSITKPMSFSFAGVLNAALSSSSTFNMRATSVAAQSTYSSTTTTTQTVTTTTSSADGCFLALVPNADNGITLSSFNNLTTDCLLMSDGTAT